MKKRIGIPRALSYYTFYPLWKSFLEELGLEVVISGETNRKHVEKGIFLTVTDACIPIKLLHGHIAELKDKVDYIFLPRLVSADGISTFCPKFLGLPDMVRHSMPGLPIIIDVRYHMKRGSFSLWKFLAQVGKMLGYNFYSIGKGYIKAKKTFRLFLRLQQQGFLPDQAMKIIEGKKIKDKCVSVLKKSIPHPLRLAVLGYPYALYDSYVNVGLFEKLKKMGVEILTPEMLTAKAMKSASRFLKQNLFWYYSNKVVWAAMHVLKERKDIHGIIHVTAFGCGPDAMVDKLVELEAKKHAMPFLPLTIDEHSGEGGVLTRLEAFVDMLKYRMQQDENLLAEGCS
ncbi:MAG: 2-hydroxyglutaryl-CoA dehydratase [Firmicutes bacterium]|nr:2-hydroxyglutaryl-CoA dehydratase [Bacillota bacterium]